MGFLTYAYDPPDIYWTCGCARGRHLNAIMGFRGRRSGGGSGQADAEPNG